MIPFDAGRCPAWQESSRAIGQGDAQLDENLVSQLRQGGSDRPGGQSTGSGILFTSLVDDILRSLTAAAVRAADMCLLIVVA